MNSIERMLATIDGLRQGKKYNEAIEGLNLLRDIQFENNRNDEFNEMIDGLIKLCEKECDEMNNVNDNFIIVNFDGRRFAMLKTDRMKIKINPNLSEWINLYKIHNDSTPKNIIITEEDMDDPQATFNPKTKKVRIFKK